MKANQGWARRDVLRLGAAVGAATLAHAVLPRFSWANVKSVTLADCVAMNTADMAKESKMVMDSWDYLQKAAASIKDGNLRQAVQAILDNPAPTFAAGLMDPAAKKAVYEELTAKGLIKDVALENFLPPFSDPRKSPMPFLAAPGSGYTSHHAYPGGVVTHTALNTKVSEAIHDGYREIYGYELDRDVVIGSQILHDLHKSWVFQWGGDGSSRTELPLAGTGEHHVYSVAEVLARGLSPEFCVAQACAHNHPGFPTDEAQVVGWLQAAAILNGKDAVSAGLLDASGSTLPMPRRMEGFVTHLGDHDWILTVPACKWLVPVMKEIAAEKYGMKEADLNGKPFNALRNYAFSQATIMTLYNLYSTKGKDALAQKVTEIVTPA